MCIYEYKFIHVKFYCCTATFILHLVGVHFHAAAAELISCDREHVICNAKNSYHLAFGRKRLLTPVLGQRPLRACSDHCPVGAPVQWAESRAALFRGLSLGPGVQCDQVTFV